MRWFGLCLVFLAGSALARDVTLSEVLVPGEGWHEVKGVGETSGPLAVDGMGAVYVVDADKKVIHRIGLDGKAAVFARSSEAVGGLAWSSDGVLYAALPATQQIVRFDDKGKEEVVHQHAPARDLAVRGGRIYYTAPQKKAVFLVGRVEPVATGISDPSGIAFWRGGGTLIVGDAGGRHLYAFRIGKDGALDAGERYYPLQVRPKQPSGVRALILDSGGLLYAATTEGVQVFDGDGRLSGVLLSPERAATTAVALGGAERNQLFIACGGKFWQRKTKVKGAK